MKYSAWQRDTVRPSENGIYQRKISGNLRYAYYKDRWYLGGKTMEDARHYLQLGRLAAAKGKWRGIIDETV